MILYNYSILTSEDIMKAKQEFKTFNIRIPRDLWTSIKVMAMELDTTMNALIVDLLTKKEKRMKNKLEKDLTQDEY